MDGNLCGNSPPDNGGDNGGGLDGDGDRVDNGDQDGSGDTEEPKPQITSMADIFAQAKTADEFWTLLTENWWALFVWFSWW